MRWPALLSLLPAVALADVAEDAGRVGAGWNEAGGAEVELEQRAVFLFPQAVQTVELRKPGCGRLVLVGSMGIAFDVEITGAEQAFRSSFAGLVDVGPFCVGTAGTAIHLAAPAGRGTVEVLFGRGATSAVDVFGILGRPRPRDPVLGTLPSPPPSVPGGRERFAARRKREGATRVDDHFSAEAEPTIRLTLQPACYAAEIAADGPRLGGRYDLDAQAVVVTEGNDDDASRILAQDRSSAAEAALEFCVVNPSDVEVRVKGTSGAARTRVSLASFPLALEVPRELGAGAKGAVERAWRSRGGTIRPAALRQAEFFATGLVRRRFTSRAGACHLAFATALDGTPRNLVLTVGRSKDEIRQTQTAASVAFCTGTDGSFDVEVESRGAVPGIGFLLYEVGS